MSNAGYKTLKSRIVKIFQHENSFAYINQLDNVVEGYNQSYHSIIRMKPAAVSKKNEQQVWEQLYVEPFLKERKEQEVQEENIYI